jgi:LDH2 family malate/lactate/ureidoglycolate dehydrogenase
MLRYTPDDLRVLVAAILVACGLCQEDARTASMVLVDADLRGIDSHGIAHLATHKSYVKGLKSGTVNAEACSKTLMENSTTAVVDGNGGLGPVVAYKAMMLSIEKAKESGVGLVGVRNGHHYGAAGYYSMLAIPHDMIGISMTQASPAVLPTFGKSRKLGTNALSFAVPAGEEPPYVLDMATSAVAVGKLELAKRRGEHIPRGWAVNAEGQQTKNPQDYWDGGALLPLGSEPLLSSYKGYGMAMLVDILSGILTGVGFGSMLSRQDLLVGFFLGAFRIDNFRPVEEFKSMMDEMIRDMKSTERDQHNQPVLIPGQREHEMFVERSRWGIPLHTEVVKDLKALAEEFRIEFPSAI